MKYLVTILLSLFIFAELDLSAQTSARDEDRFFYGLETDEDMKPVQPEKTFFSEGIQYGAILSPVYLNESGKDESLSSLIFNSKIWGKSYLWNNAFLYAGVKDSYLHVLSQDGDIYSDVESENTFDLDQTFVSMSVFEGALKFSAGRQYFNIGTGLVLNGRGDGAELNYSASIFTFDLMGLYTGLLKADNNPYGLSDKDFTDGAERVFSGAVLSADIVNQRVYIFGLIQTDLADQEETLETRYNSQYYGIGINGVILSDLSYFAEAVFQSGESYITQTSGNEKSKIAAYAANTGLNYFIPVKLNPTLTLQYAYGSGDKYRDDYTTGNRASGATGYDKGFISFGTYSGGYALKPVLSNIHIFRAGITVTPLATMNQMMLNKLSIGTKYSYYMKDNEESSINSGEAEGYESNIGQGVDASLRWQIFYDASFYVNYGIFLPGEAYDETDSQTFVMSGITLSI